MGFQLIGLEFAGVSLHSRRMGLEFVAISQHSGSWASNSGTSCAFARISVELSKE